MLGLIGCGEKHKMQGGNVETQKNLAKLFVADISIHDHASGGVQTLVSAARQN